MRIFSQSSQRRACYKSTLALARRVVVVSVMGRCAIMATLSAHRSFTDPRFSIEHRNAVLVAKWSYWCESKVEGEEDPERLILEAHDCRSLKTESCPP